MKRYITWGLIALVYSICITATWGCKPQGTAPEPAPAAGQPKGGRLAASAVTQHPKAADGTLLHDYMEDGTGKWRCWYCDKELPPGSTPKPIPK